MKQLTIVREPNFQERHEHINKDPLEEMKRRTALWASCPDGDGYALEPSAQIIPRETVEAAIKEMTAHRRDRWLIASLGMAAGAISMIVLQRLFA